MKRLSGADKWTSFAVWTTIFGVLAVIAASCEGGGGGGEPSAAERVAAGKARFEKTCSTCHGKDATGMPKLGKNLHENQFIQSKTDDEMVKFIETGRPAWDPANTRGVDMPPRGGDPTLTEKDIRNIVAFLRTLQ
jgi:mono/diheme cytochrome c family protein